MSDISRRYPGSGVGFGREADASVPRPFAGRCGAAAFVCVLAGLALSGCAGGQGGAMAMNHVPVAPLESERDTIPERTAAAVAVREADVASRDRWSSPFAVSGGGLTVVRAPRSIVVLGADSLIAAAIANQEEALLGQAEATRPSGTPAASPRPGPAPASAPEDAAEVETEAVAVVSAEAASEARQTVSLLGTEAVGVSAVSAREETIATAAAPGPAIPPASQAGDAGSPDVPLAVHRVEPGDTWSRIVIRYRVTSQALAEANPDVDPNLIRVGQLIRVPAAVSAAPTPAMRSHEVGRGETLRGIASRYNVSADEIRRANGMSDERVVPGQMLLIPAGSSVDR